MFKAWMYYIEGDNSKPVLTYEKQDWAERYEHWREVELVQKREWVGLTDEDFQPMVHKAMMYYGYDPKHSTLTSGAGFYELVRAVEAKLKEKNT